LELDEVELDIIEQPIVKIKNINKRINCQKFFILEIIIF